MKDETIISLLNIRDMVVVVQSVPWCMLGRLDFQLLLRCGPPPLPPGTELAPGTGKSCGAHLARSLISRYGIF